MRPCAFGLRRIAACRMSGRTTSSIYSPLPRRKRRSSSRSIGLPIRELRTLMSISVSIQLALRPCQLKSAKPTAANRHNDEACGSFQALRSDRKEIKITVDHVFEQQDFLAGDAQAAVLLAQYVFVGAVENLLASRFAERH